MAPDVRSLMNRALGERGRVTEGAWHEGEEGVTIGWEREREGGRDDSLAEGSVVLNYLFPVHKHLSYFVRG